MEDLKGIGLFFLNARTFIKFLCYDGGFTEVNVRRCVFLLPPLAPSVIFGCSRCVSAISTSKPQPARVVAKPPPPTTNTTNTPPQPTLDPHSATEACLEHRGTTATGEE